MTQSSTQKERWRGVGVVSLLSVFALAVHGFHPYAEDGGLYVAGIKERLDPRLYAVHPEFVLAPLRFSPFASIVAAVTRMSHLPLGWVLFALYAASLWATLYAGWMVASRITASRPGRCGAVSLLACWLTMPIAGTSLLLMDPYVTARSVSTPLALLAVAWALDAAAGSRVGLALCAAALLLALVHPLMAAYALAAVLVVLSRRDWRAGVALAATALTVAAVVQAWAPAESLAYVQAALTRYYWFPMRWEWYEQLGLVAPLALLYGLRRRHVEIPSAAEAAVSPGLNVGAEAPTFQSRLATGWRTLSTAALAFGGIALAVAAIFSRASLATHLVARLQPLRCFQMVYEVLFLLVGAWLGERWLGRRAWRWCVMLALCGGLMFVAQRGTYPASQHFEFPWAAPRNPWSQAFEWARDNTPKDAPFALDSRYITYPDEDAQGFRAIAERSALPDYSKDGGEASITPALAEEWLQGEAAQQGLDRESDEARRAALEPLGVSWVVLRAVSTTGFICPYRNAAVKVCRLP